MIIETLVCNGETQTIEQREVPDNFFATPTPQPTEAEKLRADIDFIAVMIGVTI